MDSSSSSMTSVGEATEALKSLLRVGNAAGQASVHSCLDSSQTYGGVANSERVSMSGSHGSSLSNGEIPVTELLKKMNQKSATKQQVLLSGSDMQNSFSVYSMDVDIIASERSSSPTLSAGSNKVKTSSIVNFEWEHKFYYGNLVAVHKNGIHVAYVLKGKSGGVVRVINTRTTQRSLLKGFSGRVTDIAFAHVTAIVLGAVDEMGNMSIYDILEDQDGKLDAELLLNIVRPADADPHLEHRLIWCPYMPEEEEPSSATGTTLDSCPVDDAGKLLVLTHGKVAEMWNIDVVLREHGTCNMMPEDVEAGYLVINNHTDSIVDACYSPDGSALATASLDGEVKFFQVYLHDKCPPRCIHQWKPHEGRPVTSLFFLDDQKNPNPDVQFWKFAVTGADHNQEIKIWACESWTCLQTLKFLANPNFAPNYHDTRSPCIKAQLDLSANYLILSDINRKALYVLQLYKDTDTSRAHVTSVAEFLLTQPCLSFAVLDASRRKFRKLADHQSHMGDLTTGEVGELDDEEAVICDTHTDEIGVIARIFSVHTKVLQELQIKFKPECSVPPPAPSSLSSLGLSEVGMRDQLSDVSMDTSQSDRDSMQRERFSERSQSYEEPIPSQKLYEGHPSSRSFDGSQPRALGKPPAPTLIPPEAYASSSPRKDARDTTIALDSARSSATVQSGISSLSTLTQVTGIDEDALRSARGSLLNGSHNMTPQAVSSPHSSITITPGSSRDLSALSAHDSLSSHPLPPPTPSEESALVTPPSYRVQASAVAKVATDEMEELGQSLYRPKPHVDLTTPRSSRSSEHVGVGHSHDFYTSSPSSRASRGDFKPPTASQSDGEEISVVETKQSDEFFDASAEPPRPTLGSANSSSSTSLEVSEIMEGAKKAEVHYEENEDESEGENDDEECEDDEHMQKTSEGGKESPQVAEVPDEVDKGADDSAEEIEEVIDAGQSDDEQHNTSGTTGGSFNTKAWPAPPAVQDEAQRLAQEALHRAATFTIEQRQSQLYADQMDDDVQVEEEQDENEAGQIENKVIFNQNRKEVYNQKNRKEVYSQDDVYDQNEPLNQGGDIADQSDMEAPEFIPSFDLGDTSEHVHVSGIQRPQGRRWEYDFRRLPHNDPSGEPNVFVAMPPAEVARIEQLQSSVQQMVNLLQVQQKEIEQLRGELNKTRGTQETLGGLQCQIDNLEGLLTSKVTETLAKHSTDETERLQYVLGQRESHDKKKHETLVSTVTQTLERTISNKLERIIKEEIRSHVVPKITAIVEPIKQDIHKEVSQKLTATDSLVKDNIAKLIRSRQTVEAMGREAGNALQGPVQGACRDVLVPAFDRACNSMFQQINTSFQGGAQEYTQQLEAHLEQVRRRHDQSRDPIIQQMTSLAESSRAREQAAEQTHTELRNVVVVLRQQMEQNASFQNKIETVIHQAVYGVQENIISEVRRLVQDEVVTVVKDQHSTITTQLMDVVRSGIATPVPQSRRASPDPETHKTKVLALLKEGQLNEAFQQALQASDLNVVLFVCETVNPSHIFNQSPCPLQQAVLLSLIQQLSADLTTHVDLKYKYLEEAIMNLDATSSSVSEHIPSVLGHLIQKLTNFIQNNPHHERTRSFRILLMASKSVVGI